MLNAVGIYKAFKSALEFDAEIDIRAYVRSKYATKWIIAADFVTSGQQRVHDAFAFTVYPYEQDSFAELLAVTRNALPADIKRVKHLGSGGAAFLAAPGRYHFCFLAGSERHLLGSLEDTQLALTEVARHVQMWPESSEKERYAKKFNALAQRAKATKFNYRLLHDITLIAALSAYIAVLIAKHSRSEAIMFAFDRDAMTAAFGGIVYDMTCLDFHAACESEGISARRISMSNAIEKDARDGQPGWFDELVRAPDYIAGTLSRLNFRNLEVPVPAKVAEVLETVVAENPTLLAITMRFSIFGISFNRIRMFSKLNTRHNAYDHRPSDVVDYAAFKSIENKTSNCTFRECILRATAIDNLGLRIWWRRAGS